MQVDLITFFFFLFINHDFITFSFKVFSHLNCVYRRVDTWHYWPYISWKRKSLNIFVIVLKEKKFELYKYTIGQVFYIKMILNKTFSCNFWLLCASIKIKLFQKNYKILIEAYPCQIEDLKETKIINTHAIFKIYCYFIWKDRKCKRVSNLKNV